MASNSSLILGFVMLVSTAIAGPAPQHTAARVGAQSAPRSRDLLIARVQQAFDHRSIDEMRQLVFWGRADAAARESFDRQAAPDFDLQVGRVSIVPLRPTEKLEYTVNGIAYRPTLSPLGRVNIEFVAAPRARVRGRSTSYLFGACDGAY